MHHRRSPSPKNWEHLPVTVPSPALWVKICAQSLLSEPQLEEYLFHHLLVPAHLGKDGKKGAFSEVNSVSMEGINWRLISICAFPREQFPRQQQQLKTPGHELLLGEQHLHQALQLWPHTAALPRCSRSPPDLQELSDVIPAAQHTEPFPSTRAGLSQLISPGVVLSPNSRGQQSQG